MRDPRVDPYTEAEIAAARTAEFGNDMLPPTHPDGPRKMRHVPGNEPAPTPESFYGENVVHGVRRDLPKPPPAELGFDPGKWGAMTRAERRAVLRHARKVTR
jgi:hypothetical protein